MVFAMYLSMGKHHDYTEALAKITADTLVVHGENDLVPSSSSKRYANLIPGAEMVLVPDADHFFLGAHRDLYLRVNAFLRDAVRPQTRVPIGSVSWSEPVNGLVLGIEAPPPFKYTPIKDWKVPLFVRTDHGGGRSSVRSNPAGTWDAGAVFHVWLKNESTETRYWAEYDGAWAVAFTGAGLTKTAPYAGSVPMPLWRGPLPLAPGMQASMTFHVWRAYRFQVVGPVDAGEYELSVRYAPGDLVRMAYGDDVYPYDVPGFWVDEIQTPTITVTVEHVPGLESSLTGPG
jgi:hypothetical protein